jgi:VanZ family protein
MHTRWWPTLLVGGVILVLSLVPLGGGGPGPTGGAVAGIGVDKLLHAVDYAALVLTVLYARRARDLRACLVVFVAVVVAGGAVELLQGLVPTRSPSVLDAAANAVGTALATGGWWLTVSE